MSRKGVLDASLLLTLGEASALDLLWDDPRYDWHVTPIVRGEVRSEPTRSGISEAILADDLTPVTLEDEGELRALARWEKTVDAGEAEAIAVAEIRGWVVGIEDLFARRRLTEAFGAERWVNSATLLLHAISDGRLTHAEADAVFRRLDCFSAYAKRGVESLTDLKRGPG